MQIFGVRPGRLVAGYFLSVIAVGTIALMLPVSTARHEIGLLDALFTSTSAACVTGLTVLDTGRDFSTFGQAVILVLIQLGGLGIMTFATGLLLSLGSSLSLQHRFALWDTLGKGGTVKAKSLVYAVFGTTMILEFLGAAALFWKFKDRFPAGRAVFVSIFHAVSAFCNAGFSTFSSSLEGYRDDPTLLLIFAVLIIFGGVGFIVIREVFSAVVHRDRRLSLHSKICLTMTVLLLVLGTAAFYFAEHKHIFPSRGLGLNLPNAFFQSVTSRTAGFNTVPQSDLTELSILVTLMLMFIGACPGSTGGGIKVTTIAIIFLLVARRFAGYRNVAAFKRSISGDSVARAITVFLLAILFVVMMFGLFMFAEEKALSHTLSHGWFVDNLFEVVSAFGTVGLSLGRTPYLHAFGKILLVVLMFVGRVGPLALAFALASEPKGGEIVYLEEEVMVG